MLAPQMHALELFIPWAYKGEKSRRLSCAVRLQVAPDMAKMRPFRQEKEISLLPEEFTVFFTSCHGVLAKDQVFSLSKLLLDPCTNIKLGMHGNTF